MSQSAISLSAPPPYSETITSSSTKTHSTITYPLEKNGSTTRKILSINAWGKDWNDFSNHGRETEISITNSSNDEVYRSLRPNSNQGNCILFSMDSTTGTPIPVSETTYRWGPGHPPTVKLFRAKTGEEEEIEVHSKNIFSKAVTFESATLGSYTWRYASKSCLRNTFSSKAENSMILERIGEQGNAIEVARMVRNRETRVKGTKWNEGNGGRLEMTVEGEQIEALILSTCLLMLKKEIDRLLASQVVVIS